MEPPTLTVVEICRATGLPPSTVIESLVKPEVAGTPVSLNGKKPSEWLNEIKTPRPSKKAAKTESRVFSEKQRYQRRFQFQDNKAQGSPASRIVQREVIKEQLKRVKVIYQKPVDPATLRQGEREATRKRVTLRWQFKTYKPKEKPSLEQERQSREITASANELIWQLNRICPEPVARPDSLVQILKDSRTLGKPFILLSWDCFKIESPDRGKTFSPDLGNPSFKTLRPSIQELKVINLLKESPFPFDFQRFLPDDEILFAFPEATTSIGTETIKKLAVEQATGLEESAKSIYSKPPRIRPFTQRLDNPKIKELYADTFKFVLNSFNGAYSSLIDQGAIDRDVEFRKNVRYGVPLNERKALSLTQRMFSLYAAEMAVLYCLYGNSMVLLQNEKVSGPKYDLYARINPKFRKLPMIFV